MIRASHTLVCDRCNLEVAASRDSDDLGAFVLPRDWRGIDRFDGNTDGRGIRDRRWQLCCDCALALDAFIVGSTSQSTANVRSSATEHGNCAAIARDIQLGRTSQQIRDEIIAEVGMMAYSRTPEMQARYDAAVARECGQATALGDTFVTVTGSSSGDATTIARAILEMLQEADVGCSMPEEVETPYDGDSIEQLGNLHVRSVIVQTGRHELRHV